MRCARPFAVLDIDSDPWNDVVVGIPGRPASAYPRIGCIILNLGYTSLSNASYGYWEGNFVVDIRFCDPESLTDLSRQQVCPWHPVSRDITEAQCVQGGGLEETQYIRDLPLANIADPA